MDVLYYGVAKDLLVHLCKSRIICISLGAANTFFILRLKLMIFLIVEKYCFFLHQIISFAGL